MGRRNALTVEVRQGCSIPHCGGVVTGDLDGKPFCARHLELRGHPTRKLWLKFCEDEWDAVASASDVAGASLFNFAKRAIMTAAGAASPPHLTEAKVRAWAAANGYVLVLLPVSQLKNANAAAQGVSLNV